MSQEYILTLSCQDRPRIVASVTAILADLGANIAESAQYWDRSTNNFFMRIAFETPGQVNAAQIHEALAPAKATFGLELSLTNARILPKIIIMVSKFDHCLQHLLYQLRMNWLKAEVVAVISNHEDSRKFVESQGIPYHYIPVDKNNKLAQEQQQLKIVEDTGAELIVLARYMQVLSDQLSQRLAGRVINIHHSFLPSFKGAKPYHQAHERGVKIIGATAHFVTGDLDEGPIIEQDVERISHKDRPNDLVRKGRDIERLVLARAVRLLLEDRVLLNGHRTVVFKD